VICQSANLLGANRERRVTGRGFLPISSLAGLLRKIDAPEILWVLKLDPAKTTGNAVDPGDAGSPERIRAALIHAYMIATDEVAIDGADPQLGTVPTYGDRFSIELLIIGQRHSDAYPKWNAAASSLRTGWGSPLCV
jgi:hypothetical protein